MSIKILIADDESEIRDVLRLYIEQSGYEVVEAKDGIEAMEIFRKDKIDMALLDIMMPGIDGYRVLKNIRETSNIPVIMISAKMTESDRILGLDMGADDYITKPFAPLEAVARVKSNLRRFYSLGSGCIESELPAVAVRDLTLDLNSCQLSLGDKIIELTGVEFRIMKLLMENPGKVFTKKQIYEAGWEEEYFEADNSIMVSISKLRSKISDDPDEYIKTVRGLGYRIQ